METPYVQDTMQSPETQMNPTKGDEVAVENERYVSSKKCEYDGYTSNEEVFYQSSCEDLAHNEENFELIKNEEKSPKITTSTTTDNKNSTELRDEKMEKCSCTTEPLLSSSSSLEEGKKSFENKSVNEIKNSTSNNNTNQLNNTIITTPLPSQKKKSNKNKKSSKLLKHKKSYINLYLKLKDKLINNNNNNKTKKSDNKKFHKTKSFDHEVISNPLNSNNELTTEAIENHPLNEKDVMIETSTPIMNSVNHQSSLNPLSQKFDETKVFPSNHEVVHISDMVDIREITVINADGDTIIIPARRRTDSLPRALKNTNKHQSSTTSIPTDATVTPKLLKKEKQKEVEVEVEKEKEKEIEKENAIKENDEPIILSQEESNNQDVLESNSILPKSMKELLSMDITPEERPQVCLDDIPERSNDREVIENEVIPVEINVDNIIIPPVAPVNNGDFDVTDPSSDRVVITTIEEEVIPEENKVIVTTIEEHMLMTPMEDDEKIIAVESDDKERNGEVILSDPKASCNDVNVVLPDPKELDRDVNIAADDKNDNNLIHDVSDHEIVGASIDMIKPFHPETDITINLDKEEKEEEGEEPSKDINKLPIINENINSTPLEQDKLTVPNPKNTSESEDKIPLVKLPKDEIEKRKLSHKRKPLKTSLKNSVFAIRYFHRQKEEAPQYVVVEDFERFKENTQKCIESSRNFEANTTTINENNERFKEVINESFKIMKDDIGHMNCEYEAENKKLKEEIMVLHQQIQDLEEEKEREIEQLRNEVAEEIIKLQDSIKRLEDVKDQEIEQLRSEITELHQKEDNYQDVIEHHLLNINTTLIKLKEEQCGMKENIYQEIQQMKENKIMEMNPEDLVKQEELENISKQLVKTNVQWNELSDQVQNLPIQLQKDVDDKFEGFNVGHREKSQQFEDFMSDAKKNQTKLERCIKELIKLQKANENNLENKTKSINETIHLQSQQIQEFEETKHQVLAQSEKLNTIGERVNHYCSNDYLDTVIELEDLRKITNRTTEELFNLQKLNLYCKNLDRLPKRIFSLENLNELWLGRNNLNNLNDKIGNLKNLKRLSIADNNLSQLPTGIKNLKNLTHLYLYKNKLKELPPEIGELENLIHLDVESNKLTKLPEALKNLTKLENLDIENNLFNEFPAIIFELKNLVKLNLCCNKFFFIPRELENLTRLKHLNLKDNYLRSFPYSVIKFTNLEELDLSNNLFKDIPSEIRYLDKLKTLIIANVRIEEIIPEFGYLKELKILNLSNCNLRMLPNCLKNLQNLEEINLTNNDGITSLPDYFRSFKNLKRVLLNRNVVYKNGMEFPRYQGPVYSELLQKNIIRTE